MDVGVSGRWWELVGLELVAVIRLNMECSLANAIT